MNEVKQAFEEIKKAHEVLIKKHEEFTMLLNDMGFEEAEIWMQACRKEYTAFTVMFHDCVNANKEENEKDDDDASQENDNESSVNEGNEEHNEPSGSHITSNEEAVTEKKKASSATKINMSAKPFTVKHEKAKLFFFYW